MIAHVILFRPKPDLDRAGRVQLAAAFEQAVGEIPSIRRARIGRRVRNGRAYEHAMPEDFSYAAVLEFDDAAGLQTYLDHPAHEPLAQRFFASVERALFYDYEWGEDAGALADLSIDAG